MRTLIQQSRITQLLAQRNGYMVLASGLLLLSFFLTALCFDLGYRQRTFVLPPVVEKGFWVSQSAVSSSYLTQMSLFFAALRLNVTPDSADFQRDLVLRYTDPAYYGTLKTALIGERDRLVAQHITTVFYPVNYVVHPKAFTVEITGDLMTQVGTTQMPSQRITYRFSYHYSNGRLWIVHFDEVIPHV